MNRKIVLITIFTTILIIVSFKSLVGAEDLSDLQTRKNELQEQIAKSNEQIENIQIEITENLEQLSILNQKIDSYEEEIILLEEELNKITIEIDTITEKLNSVQESYMIQRDALQNRL